MTIGDARQPARLRQLAQLEVRQQGGDLVAGEEAVVALAVVGEPSPPMPVGVGVGGDDEVGAGARGPPARPGPCDSGTSGLGVFVTLGNWPSGAICSGDRDRRGSPAAWSTSIAVIDADAVQRREDDRTRRAFGGGTRLCLRHRSMYAWCGASSRKCTLPDAHRVGPGQRPDRRDLIDEVGHDLVVGRHRLAAALVVELAAVVVGRVVRGRDVQPAVGLQVADGERQLRRGQVARAVRRQDVRVDAVGRVDAGGVLGEVPARQVQDRVGQVGVVDCLRLSSNWRTS